MTEVAITSLIQKVVDRLCGLALEQIGYMWNCNKNIRKLKKEAQDLKDTMGRVQQQIEIANKKGDKLKIGVKEWLSEAGTLISMAEEFLQEEATARKTCFNLRICVNLGTLHHYGKKATNDVSSLLECQEYVKVFENIFSIPTSTPGIIELYQRKNLEGIGTHKSVFEEIIKSIEDESIQIIGIYGQGGVGKTTLAKEVASSSLVKDLFASVEFITVSQAVDAEKIKDKVQEAAKRIINGEKILIILDDVWRRIELEEVGIPCGTDHKNCKVLVTSRKKGVCESMKCEKKIHVDSLPEKEAWRLFKSVVGERVESDVKMKEIAVKVAKKCEGLPLLVQVVGNALKDKDITLWKAALDELGKHAPSNIDDEISDAYICLKLSYDLLKNKYAKLCLLLCSMFPEDVSIPIDYLVYYVVGLEKFNDGHSLEDARNRVLLAVDILKSSCLLQNGRHKLEVSMHDVVRDVALLIASEGSNKLSVEAGKGLTEWQPGKKRYEN